jgi:hypothetical protein
MWIGRVNTALTLFLLASLVQMQRDKSFPQNVVTDSSFCVSATLRYTMYSHPIYPRHHS